MMDKHLEDEAKRKLASETVNSSMLATESHKGEACLRPCIADDLPRICYFKWVLENYQAVGA